jgi:hypothetical protein
MVRKKASRREIKKCRTEMKEDGKDSKEESEQE